MKKWLILFLSAMLVCSFLGVPAMAEDTLTTEASSPAPVTEPSAPTVPAPTESSPTAPAPTESSPATDPTESVPDNTTAPTETTQPCSHTYGNWEADEGNHWKTCTQCGHRESSGHSWASETVTVSPTCKDPGGVCKICTVCTGVLVTEIIPQTQEHTYDTDCDEACNICGATREVSHEFGTGWKYSYKGHWHTCTECGAAGEIKPHYPGPAATEEKNQICLTCSYVMTKKLAHSHKWNSQWSSDTQGHWYSCDTCSEQKGYTAHTYTDDCDTGCEICGYIRETAHQYEQWHSDESGHWQVCELCGEKTPREKHQPKQNGLPETQCIVCLRPMTVEHVHEFQAEWRYDDLSHWQECSCGEREGEEEHHWDEGREEKNLLIYSCETCLAERQEEIPEKAFPWLLAAAGGVVLLCLSGIVACILIIRRNKEDER